MILIGLIICVMMSISSASAAQNDEQLNENLTVSIDNINIDISVDDIKTDDVLSLSNEEDDVLTATGDFYSLYSDINGASGDVIYLDKDYEYTGSYSSGVYIYKSNVIIDGQGHTIDGKNSARIFQIGSGYQNVTFKNIYFINGYSSAAGGAIYAQTNINVINCTFDSNYVSSTSNGGGAIYLKSKDESLVKIIDSIFKNNAAYGYGGAIRIDKPNNQQMGYDVVIENCYFTENSVSTSENTKGGGAIQITNPVRVNITSSKFENNYANNSEGGCIRYSGPLTIMDSEFYSNYANLGGALCYGQTELLKIIDSVFENNHAKDEGGAIKTRMYEMENVIFTNNTAGAKGGAIMYRSSTAELKNITFDSNTAPNGGAIYVHNDVSSMSVSNSNFINNNATNGGALFSESLKTITFSDTTFERNRADKGGALYFEKGKMAVSDSEFKNNNATEGGAIYVVSDESEVFNSVFTDNTAVVGGGVYWNGAKGKIHGTTFNSNDGVNGASVYWRANSGSIVNSYFSHTNPNVRSVYWYGNDGLISSSTFYGKNAVYVDEHASVTFESNNQYGNVNGDYAIYNDGISSFDSNNFDDLIFNNGTITSPTYVITLDNNTVLTEDNYMTVYSAVVDDNGNYIKINKNLINVYESTNLTTTFNNTHYISPVNNIALGEHRVSAIGYENAGLADLTVKQGGILFLLLNLTVNQTNYGEKVVFTTTVVNTTYNGTIDLSINDIHYNVTLINGTAVLTLYNMAPNTYEVVASYMDYNQTLSVDVEIKVELRNSTINITAFDIYYGNVATIGINTTNGTTGNIFIFINNKMYIVKLNNSTATLNLDNLAGGNYTVYAYYSGDSYFKECYNSTDFTVYKYKPQINITVNDIQVGQIATIKVDLPHDATGKVYVDVGTDEYVYTNKSSIVLYVNNCTAGNISVRAFYRGDDKYYEANNTTSFEVTKKNMTIFIQTTTIPVGENETITVTLPPDAKGIVLLDVNGTSYWAYAENTVAKFVISGLARGHYNVTATYAEGPIYNTAVNQSSFWVRYIAAFDFNVSASVDDELNVLVDISLPSDVNGDVVVEIGGNNYTAHVSKGKALVTIPDLNHGEYKGTVYLENDTKYINSNRTFTVDLERKSPTLSVDYIHTIYVDDDAIITVNINNDATGNITLKINNTNYVEEIANGQAIFNITGLEWNTYPFNVTYEGNRKYLPITSAYTLEVSRIHNYYSHLETADIYVGENATVTVTFEDDTTGTVTLIINGSTHIITLKNGTGSINISGLPVGKHIINATYSGDRKYEPCNRIFEDFFVRKIINYDFVPEGKANDTHANITVTLPDDATGYVNITLNNRLYSNIEVINGKANLTADGLEAGKLYPVQIDYSGNDKYEPGSKNITLRSNKTLDYVFLVEGDDIHVGDIAYVMVFLPNATEGDQALIKVGNRAPEYASVVNGTISHPVIGLAEGEYFVTVTYLGNEKYESSTKSGNLYVSKRSTYPFEVETNEPQVGENLTVEIRLPYETTGNVTVTVSINNTNYTANVTNGTAYVVIPGLPVGVYNTTVYYSGDDKYHNATKTIEVIVEKVDVYTFTVTPKDIHVGEEETIKITLPKDVSGTVKITIENTSYINQSVTVVNGTGWFNVTGLDEGPYELFVSLKDDPKYEDDTVYGNFEVSSISDYLFNVTVSPENYVKENITFTIELPTNASGDVEVIIFQRTYKGTVDNGIAIVNVTAPYSGTYPYLARFEEEGKYSLKTHSGSVVISKKDVVLNPEYDHTIYVGNNTTFKVQLPEDATGTITVISRGIVLSETLVNGSANITVPNYDVARQYSPSVSYSGDVRYNPATVTLTLNVIKVSDYDFDFNVSDINVGQSEIVNVTLPSDATDDVLIYGNFSTKRYSQAIINGNVSFTINDLAAGTYNITVLYQGYEKYESKNITKTFTVSKVNSTIAIDFINNDTVVVIVPDDATGNVLINVGTINENVTIVDGKATLYVGDLYPREYLVTASYAGDGKYLENATNKLIDIPQTDNYLLNVSVQDIIVGENATVIVKLPSDATGHVDIVIDNGEVQTASVNEGTAILKVSNLPVGNHDVKINFTDDKYLLKSNSTSFNVAQIKTVLSPQVNLEERTVNITVAITENATGNITIYIDNTPYSRKIVDNKVNLVTDLIPGDHVIRATYGGDTNHTSASTNAIVVEIDKIIDYEIIIDLEKLITVIENNTIVFTVPEYAKGNLDVVIGDEEYFALINTTTHKAVLTTPYLNEGNYTVIVSYMDELYDYKEFTNNFTVIRINTTIDLEVADITKDLSEIINITLNETATGEVLIDINGIVFHKILENGKTNLTRGNLNDGNYTVTVTYLGDDIFNVNSTTKTFEVRKLTTDLIIDASDIIVGQNLDITITLSGNITDLISVKVGEDNYTTFAYKGKANLTVSGLTAGDYDITAYYAGDNDYYPATNVTSVTVNSKKLSNITVHVEDITVGEDITVYVNTSEPINGPVYVTIAGVAYTEELVDGKVNFTVSDLIARDYHISAFFMGNEEYELCNTTSTFTVHKKDTPVKLDVENIEIGENEIFNVTVNKDATGHVLINVEGVHIYADIVNGSAIANVSDFAVGSYNVTVTYIGDDNYNANSTSGSFVVSKLTTTIEINGSDIFVGQEEVFNITTSANITEVVIINVNNVNYTTFVENGVGSFVVYNLPANVYTATVYFPGNTKYDAVSDNTTFTVYNKKASAIDIDVESIFVGEDAIIYVNVTEGTTGTVAVIVAGDTYTKQLSDSKANFTIPGLIARDYHVTAYYFGDEYYLGSNSTANFVVIKKDTIINASAKDVNVGEATTISVNVTEGATGVVLIDINGTKYYANLSNSKVVLDINNFAVGYYDVIVNYLGDNYFHSNDTKTGFTVSKLTPEINISLPDGERYGFGDNVFVHLTGPSDITGVAIVTVLSNFGEDQYTVYINNGEGELILLKPDVEIYNVSAIYQENYKYTALESNKVTFEVIMNGTEIDVNAHNIHVGETETIIVTFPQGEYSGNVTIYVDGVPYNRTITYDPATNISQAILTLDDLVSGNYHVKAVYVMDEDGIPVVHEGSTSFAVSKIASSIVINPISDSKVGEDVTITFEVSPSDATGNITVYVNGVLYTGDLSNLTIIVSNLSAGPVLVHVYYNGDNKYLGSQDNTSFTVYKNEVIPVLSVSDININQTEEITVTLPVDATGYVLININGTHYYAEIIDGIAKYSIDPATTGTFNVVATYIGDNKYYSNETSGSYKVSKIKTDIIVSGKDIIVGHDEELTITTSDDLTEVIIIEIDGKNYTSFIENGKGNYTVIGLSEGTHNVKVYFEGSEIYESVSNKTSFVVNPKLDSQINVSVADITVGDDITVYVNATEGINGPVYVTIAGVAYTEELVNGKVNFTVSGLIARDYQVSAFFMGNDEYKLCNTTSTFTVHKKNTPISLEVSDISMGDDEIINVTVEKGATGYVLINVGGTPIYADINKDGVASAVISDLMDGNYPVEVTYLGDDIYNANSTSASFNVSKLTTAIDINGSDIYVGQTEVFNITTSADITEVVYVEVAGVNYTAFVEKGVGSFSIAGLPADVYTATVYFPGNTKYNAANSTTTFTVYNKKDSAIDVAVESIFVGEDAIIYVNVTEGATGTVAVIVAGDTYTKELSDSKANFTISGLIARDYHVTAYYLGDEYYSGSNSTASFTVIKKDTIVNASAKDINVGDVAIINVNVTEGATGVVLIDINGTKYYANLTNSKVTVDINNLAVGYYDVIVTYMGDDYFHSNDTTTSFVVSKLIPDINIILPYGEVYAYGDNVIIHVTGPSDVTGVAIVTVGNIYGNDSYTVYINNGEGYLTIEKPDVDDYNVSAVYEENYKYLSSESLKVPFEVYMNGTEINVNAHDILVGQKETIIVTFPQGEYSGNVSIYVEGVPYNATITYNATTNISRAVLTLDEDFVSGLYHVKAAYIAEEDGKIVIHEGTTTFTVSKIPSTVVINPISDIKVGEDVTITFEVSPSDATGNITVYVNGVPYTRYLSNLTLIVPDLGAGQVLVHVYYNGDVKYLESQDNTSFMVYKNEVIPELSVSDINIDQTEEITVLLPEDATGYVLINVNGTHYYADIVNGIAKYNITPPMAGTYDVIAIYEGDNKYYSNSTSDSYTVSKLKTDITIAGKDIVVGQDEVLTITTSVDLTEVIFIEIDGVNYTSFITDGKGNYTVSGLSEGLHNVTVYFEGDEKFLNANNKTSFTVNAKAASAISINVTDIIVGEDAIIYVNVTPGATGNVTVVIRGKEYTEKLDNGKATFTIPDLAARDYEVTAIYNGDEYYLTSNNTAGFTVEKRDLDITVTAQDITVGDDEIIEINLSVGEDGIVLVDINSTGYYVDITGGKGVLTVKDLGAGIYDVTATYLGDDLYDTKSNSTSFNVKAKEDADMKVDVGDDNVTVTLPEDATGNVTVVIDGEVVTVANATDSPIVIDISDLAPGNHTVEVIYSGDDNYAPDTNSSIVDVPKVDDYPIDVNVAVDENNATIEITLPEDVNGVVLVDVDGVGYYANVTDGKATLELTDLPAGEHEITVTYPGDDKYDSKSNSTSFTVIPKEDADMKVDVSDDSITVTLPEDATGNVTVVIDGEVVNVSDAGESPIVIDISDLAPGNHTVEVIYSGDDKYAPDTNSSIVDVPKVDDYPIDVNVAVDENDAKIEITLPEDATGVVFVDVGGVGYYANVTDGKATLEIKDLPIGEYDVTVSYPGDDKYAARENSTLINITDKGSTPIDILTHNITVGEDLSVNVVVLSGATGNITIEIDGKNYTSEVISGISKFIVSNLTAGNYTVVAYYPGDYRYNSNKTSEYVVVDKIQNYSIDITEDGKNLTIRLPEDATGNVTVIVDGENFTGEIVNGTVTIYDPSLTSGPHNVSVIYDGDDKYSPKRIDTPIDIKNRAIITAPHVVKYYSGPERFYVYLEDLNGNKIANASISITINGVTYNRTTDENGTASIALNLNSNNYTAFVVFNGNEEFNSTSALSGVNVLPTIFANDVVKVYRNGTQYYALFLDGEGNPLANTEVSFNIHGVFYTRTTNASGWAKLNINLEKGTYLLTAINPVTGEMRTNTIMVYSQITENSDLIKYYRNGSQFDVRIIGDDGNPVGAGEAVKFNIHGTIYTRYTNGDGHATLNINLEPGDYIITTYYKDCREGNHIHVLPVLFAKDLEMSYKDGSQFKAHLLDGQGNPYPNQTITFNVNGVMYERTTDAAGDAKLNINLEPGEYIITSSYNGENISNKITIH